MAKPKESTAGAQRSSEKEQKWPDGFNPIIALIPKEGAESEGQLKPSAILPYIYIGFGWQLGSVKSSNGRYASMMEDSARLKH
eukprot:13455160-Heterocapsa_arctica.AAC.1